MGSPATTVLGPGAGALDRGLAMLDHLAVVRTCTTQDLAAALGLSRSTAYRLVDRLVEQGWLVQEPGSGLLRLGPSAARLASAAVRSTGLSAEAVPVLVRLMRETRETASLAVPNGVSMVFVHRETGPRPVAVTGALGVARPLHSTSLGRAYLAALPEDRLEEKLAELVASPESPVEAGTVGSLRSVVEATRRRGWSEDRREFDESSCCCGAAVHDHTGLPVAAISVAGVAERMERALGEVGPLVARAAAEVSAKLGYVDRGGVR
ncbi:IclR family transcriptional regulator [Streptomyces plumbiresistens]|uniref:IclR family transcriptional regulator n=1 Tax=Streptomyces plumbiresistens TaxID=511811 RepID=A0ABP7SLZ2_9ACTN